ncbi:MAG: hypothetical protein HY912_21680 [Desulfomonile tiedjei]|uniref:Lipoprotein n=1 Tax=Desulfomonile tiedjei TaxID=2358 RepID=A0A9D6V732_9BACT|nr:hypothetical protein [Desulfomonile tiedjei]
MKLTSVIIAVSLLVMPLLTSCSSLRLGSPVKAGFEADEEGWASRNIPGVKKLSDLIPPPNEARQKWDDQRKQRYDLWGKEGGL